MINYTPQNQLSLDLFKHPFEQALDKENRWVKLASLIPWDSLASVYATKLDATSGRKSVDIRTVIAALIEKHKLKLDDRGTVQMIQENIYLQFFCGLPGFTIRPVFDPSLFVDIRKRLGNEEFDKFNKLVIEKSEKLKPHQARISKPTNNSGKNDDEGTLTPPKNKGTLKVDATIADQEITYPTDLKLLNECREKLEQMIDLLYIKQADKYKPRDYRRVARKEYLSVAKKKRKTKKELRRGIKSQLQYVGRDLKIVGALLEKPGRDALLTKREKELLEVIKQVYAQQKYMYDNKTHQCEHRIVNLYQPHVRPMPRGKDKNKVEFGAKINISEVNGFVRIDRLGWEAFNEGGDVEIQVMNYYEIYGRYPEWFLADQIYLNQKNRKFLKENGIKICGKPLGRPPKQEPLSPSQKHRKKKKNAERNHVEGKFGQAKRGYRLNDIKARLPETSESWINMILFVMNLIKLAQVAEKFANSIIETLKTLVYLLKFTAQKQMWKILWKYKNTDPNTMAIAS